MEKFRVVVAGGRLFNNQEMLDRNMDRILSRKSLTHKIVIVSGKAKGADSLGEVYAKKRGYDVVEVPADWDKFGKRAGYLRNESMASNSDATVAFWDGKSKGTKHMIDLTKEYGNLLKVVSYK